MTKQTVKAKKLPECELENCRVLPVGIDQYAECLMEGPNTCPHALPFGYCFLCKHPSLDVILENTRKSQQVAAN
jgi:hypothetical protein